MRGVGFGWDDFGIVFTVGVFSVWSLIVVVFFTAEVIVVCVVFRCLLDF